ncbi:MAG: response regulator transcription factor [Chitinophagaceae bacterium]|nr:MAG: response regulator transcription factor [Chitinophagaceae bacterium]
MNIVIIEDEEITAKDLANTIMEIEPSASIIATLSSVKMSRNYFANLMDKIDLIFSDIQLGDGTSFDIFENLDLEVPVVFCTAFDEYALQAFDSNGIDYILKPIDEAHVSKAIRKFKLLTGAQDQQSRTLQEIISLVKQDDLNAARSILVYHKDRIIPVETSSVAHFYVKSSVVHITTFDNKKYLMTKSLDDLEKIVGPAFFRANRQFLINRKVVLQATSSTSRKLTVELTVPGEEQVLVSKEKMPQFLNWLTSVS